MEAFYEELGQRVAKLRKSRSISQQKLAEKANVGASYIAHIEIGGRHPTLEVLLKIADALEVPLWRLITDERQTTDERTRDAASNVFAESLHGLDKDDVVALSYLARRLRTAEKPKKPLKRAARR